MNTQKIEAAYRAFLHECALAGISDLGSMAIERRVQDASKAWSVMSRVPSSECPALQDLQP